MHFSCEDLEKLQREYQAVYLKCQRLTEGYLVRGYEDVRAREYANQGFGRRLGTLVRCIDRVFEILPPDREQLPTSDEFSDAAINIQAFVINVFGCVDNLAWIWAREKGLSKDDGSPILTVWIGLSKKNKFIRRSLSRGFQEYLTGLDGWFDYLANFRHALAHRIPLYIPPYSVTDENRAAYQELEDRLWAARIRMDCEEIAEISDRKHELVAFKPWMTHSFEEDAEVVRFHPQLMADFNTIDELGQRMLEELDRQSGGTGGGGKPSSA